MRDPLALPNLTRRSVVFDVVVAVVAGGFMGLVQVDTGQTVAVISSALIAVALAVRRLAPSVMIALALLSAALQVITADIAIGSALLYSILFATVGGHPNRTVRRVSLWVAIVGSFVATWPLHRSFPDNAATGVSGAASLVELTLGVVATAFVVVGGWSIGFMGHQRRSVAAAQVSETIAELERRRILDLYAEQSERSRLARDMHDVVAHSLAVVIAQAEGARFSFDAKPDAARDALGVIADTARTALGDVRGVLEELRDTGTTGEVSRVDRDELYGRMRAAGMTVIETEDGSADDADPTVARAAFGILTESLTNALKYGDLDHPVEVVHDWRTGCTMTVRNLVADDPLAPGGARHGIIGMGERARQVGGSLSSDRDGDGWLVQFTAVHDSDEGVPR